MKRPSPTQERLLRAMEECGPLPDYYNLATTRALVRNLWVEEFGELMEPHLVYMRRMLRITTRGRWALRRLDVERAA